MKWVSFSGNLKTLKFWKILAEINCSEVKSVRREGGFSSDVILNCVDQDAERPVPGFASGVNLWFEPE